MQTSKFKGMRRFIVIALVLFAAQSRQGAAISTKEVKVTEALPQFRSVSLGVFFLYDDYVKHQLEKKRIHFNMTEYYSALVKMAETVHLRNVTCTNISLVFVGSSELNMSSGVEKLINRTFGTLTVTDLDVEATLYNLKRYAEKHRREFAQSDLTVLVTGRSTVNNSDFCRNKSQIFGISKDPEYSSYCKPKAGATFHNGICGSNVVAIIRDDDIFFHGATGLAQQIVALMGVTPDNLRNQSECPNNGDYFTSIGWSSSAYLDYPGLSECAEGELIAHIESMSKSSNECWNNISKAKTYGHKVVAEVNIDSEDLCRWLEPNLYKCNKTMKPRDYSKDCKQSCCKMSRNGLEAKEEGSLGDESFVTWIDHDGKTCGKNGVCFNGKCYEKKSSLFSAKRMNATK